MEKLYKLRILANGVVVRESIFATLMELTKRTTEFDDENNLIKVVEGWYREDYDGKQMKAEIAYYQDGVNATSTIEPLYTYANKDFLDWKSVVSRAFEYSKDPEFTSDSLFDEGGNMEMTYYRWYLRVKKYEQDHFGDRENSIIQTSKVSQALPVPGSKMHIMDLIINGGLLEVEDYETLLIDPSSTESIENGLLQYLDEQSKTDARVKGAQ